MLDDLILKEELGRGALGIVYRALQPGLDRDVAVKLLHPTVAERETIRRRFILESRAAGRLHHPNLVTVYACGLSETGFYYVMEWVPGETLAARLPLPVHRAIDLFGQLARGLVHAHGHGILHRDITPRNILIATDGRAVLTDFGLARDRDRETLTASGVLLGTPRYMSPEQASGAVRDLDERSDVFSLGACLHEAVTGHPPFRERTPAALLHAIRFAEPPPLEGPLGPVVKRCLEQDPAKRYPSARALAADLEALADGLPLPSQRTELPLRSLSFGIGLLALLPGLLPLPGNENPEDRPGRPRVELSSTASRTATPETLSRLLKGAPSEKPLLLGSGRYAPFTIQRDDIHLRAAPGAHPVLGSLRVEAARVRLEKLTLTGSLHISKSPTCTVRDTRIRVGDEPALVASRSPNLALIDVTVTGSTGFRLETGTDRTLIAGCRIQAERAVVIQESDDILLLDSSFRSLRGVGHCAVRVSGSGVVCLGNELRGFATGFAGGGWAFVANPCFVRNRLERVETAFWFESTVRWPTLLENRVMALARGGTFLRTDTDPLLVAGNQIRPQQEWTWMRHGETRFPTRSAWPAGPSSPVSRHSPDGHLDLIDYLKKAIRNDPDLPRALRDSVADWNRSARLWRWIRERSGRS